jgi:hypothetical protein
MIVLGILLMGAAAAATIGVVLSSHDTVGVQVFGQSAHAHEASVVFVAGVVAGVLFMLGFSMLMSGLTRGRHRRKERRRIDRQRTTEQQTLRKRNADLEQRLAATRPDARPPTATSAPPDSVDPTTREERYADRGTG